MRYRKRPVEVDAVQFTGDNFREILDLTGAESVVLVESPAYRSGIVRYPHFRISTLEGTMEAFEGDWIIRGVAGEYYPCRDDIFQQTYEQVSPPPMAARHD